MYKFKAFNFLRQYFSMFKSLPQGIRHIRKSSQESSAQASSEIEVWRACCLRACQSGDARVHAATQFPQVRRSIACDEDLPDAPVRILQELR